LDQVFKIPLSAVFGIATIKSRDRGIGFNYKLKSAHDIDLAGLQSFEFRIGEDTFKGRILINLGPAPKLGDLVLVSVQRTGFSLSLDQIKKWLRVYGEIGGDLKYQTNHQIPQIFEDRLEVLMKLNKHIPSTLPAYGKKLNIRYRGQPLQCSKCLNLGHPRRACPSASSNWMGFVKTLVDSREIAVEMFGNWFEYLNAMNVVLETPE